MFVHTIKIYVSHLVLNDIWSNSVLSIKGKFSFCEITAQKTEKTNFCTVGLLAFNVTGLDNKSVSLCEALPSLHTLIMSKISCIKCSVLDCS